MKNTSEEEDNSDYDKNDRDDDYSDNSENWRWDGLEIIAEVNGNDVKDILKKKNNVWGATILCLVVCEWC